MNNLVVMILLALGLLGSGGAWAADKTVTLTVENMTCALCPLTVRKSLEAVDGVHRVKVSLADHTAAVTFDDDKTDIKTLSAATTNAGYPSRPQEKPLD